MYLIVRQFSPLNVTYSVFDMNLGFSHFSLNTVLFQSWFLLLNTQPYSFWCVESHRLTALMLFNCKA